MLSNNLRFDSKTVQRSALSRSRRELSNAYLLAKFGFDKSENEASKVCILNRPLEARAALELAEGARLHLGWPRPACLRRQPLSAL